MKYHYLLLLITMVKANSCKTTSVPKEALITTHNNIVELELPSNLGQGYQWKLMDTTSFIVVEHSSSSNPDRNVSSDLEIFKLKAIGGKGIYNLTFYYLRPFDPVIDTATSQKTFKTIVIK